MTIEEFGIENDRIIEVNAKELMTELAQYKKDETVQAFIIKAKFWKVSREMSDNKNNFLQSN